MIAVYAPQTIASTSILSRRASRDTPARTAEFRDAFKTSLQTWLDRDVQIAQRKFWKLFDEVDVPAIDFKSLAKLPDFGWASKLSLPEIDLEVLQAADFWAERTLFSYKPLFEGNCAEAFVDFRPLVVDGFQPLSLLSFDSVFENNWCDIDLQPLLACDLQKLQTLSLLDFSHEISAKNARRAIEATLAEIDNFSDAESVNDLVQLISKTLSGLIASSVRLIVKCSILRKLRTDDDDTRFKILSFSIHTGNSPPPAMSNSRLAAGWALVNLITNARREGYAKIQGQAVSRNLRNTVCEQRARARFNRGAQNHADHGGGRQPTRYRHPRPHHSLAQCA
jgi:hypothetical protein